MSREKVLAHFNISEDQAKYLSDGDFRRMDEEWKETNEGLRSRYDALRVQYAKKAMELADTQIELSRAERARDKAERLLIESQGVAEARRQEVLKLHGEGPEVAPADPRFTYLRDGSPSEGQMCEVRGIGACTRILRWSQERYCWYALSGEIYPTSAANSWRPTHPPITD